MVTNYLLFLQFLFGITPDSNEIIVQVFYYPFLFSIIKFEEDNIGK